MLTTDVAVEIFARTDPITQVAMYGVCKGWHHAITHNIFDMIAALCKAANIHTWPDACKCVVGAMTTWAKVRSSEFIHRVFASPIIVSQIYYGAIIISLCRHAAVGGVSAIVKHVTRGYDAKLSSCCIVIAAKHCRESFYEMLRCVPEGTEMMCAIRRAVRLGGADAIDRITSVLGIVTLSRYSHVSEAIYAGTLRRGDIRLVTIIRKHVTMKHGNELMHLCKSGNVTLAKLILNDRGDISSVLIANACIYGHVELAKYFISQHLDDIGPINFSMCFDRACSRGHVNIINMLWERQENQHEIIIDMSDINDGLALACKNGRTAAVACLIELGATTCEHCDKSMPDHIMLLNCTV